MIHKRGIIMRNLDIDLLKTFHTVAGLGQFKAAAVRLGKSTSAVSVHIQKLEEIVGERLFERDNQGSALSPRGRQLLIETRSFLADHDRIMVALSKDPVKGKIRLGIPEEYTSSFLKQFMPLFLTDFPHIELEVESASSSALSRLYERDRLDAAVIVYAKHDVASGQVLSSVQPVWAVSRDAHALSHQEIPVALHAEGCPFRALAISSLKQWRGAWRVTLSSGNAAAILAVVESGLAIAILDREQLSGSMMVVPKAYRLPRLTACQISYLSRSASEAQVALETAIGQFFGR
jgi:DNA-binding transcriptional LysR family regulator